MDEGLIDLSCLRRSIAIVGDNAAKDHADDASLPVLCNQGTARA